MGVAVSAYLQRLFRVLPEESGKLVLFVGLLALMQGGVAVGLTAADALFLTHLGVAKLPLIYVGMPVLMLGYAPVYSALVARVGMDRVVELTLIVLVAGGAAFGVGSMLLGDDCGWLLYGMKFYAGLWFIALYTLFWNFADDHFSILDGKRLYGIIAAGGAAGGTIGAAAVGWLANLVTPGRMFFLWSATAALSIVVFAVLRRRCRKIDVGPATDATVATPLQVVREVAGTLRTSRFAAGLATICFCAVALTTALEYLTLGTLAEGKSAVELAQLLGKLYALANGLTLIASLFVFNRLVAHIGVGNTALVLPLLYIVAFAGFSLQYGFGAALLALGAYQSLQAAIEYNNVNLLYNALPAAAKQSVRTFIEGLSEPLASAVVGGLLLLWAARIGSPNLALAGVIASVAALTVALVLRHDYAGALAANLRRDWLDFSPSPEHWRRCLTAADRRLLRDRALHSGDRTERIAATDLLAYTGDPAAGEALAELVHSARPENFEPLRPAIERVLRGADTATVARLLAWLESADGPDDPEMLDEFATAGALPLRHRRSWSASPEPSRMALAAIAAWREAHLESKEEALAGVRRLLRGDPAHRRWAVRALGALRQPQHAAELLPLLDTADAELRLETLRALERMAAPGAADVVDRAVTLLPDAGPTERRLILGILERVGLVAPLPDVLQSAGDFSAAEARQLEAFIVTLGPRAIAVLIDVLRNPSAPARTRAIAGRALARVSSAQLELAARGAITAELHRAHACRRALALLGDDAASDSDGRCVLRRFYADTIADGADLVVQWLGLTGRLPDVDLIRASLSSGNTRDRANAVEAIEQSCPRRVFAPLRPLFATLQTAAGPTRSEGAVHGLPVAPDSVEGEPGTMSDACRAMLRSAAASTDPIECAAALLALREADDPEVEALCGRQRHENESPAVVRALAGWLPAFAPVFRRGPRGSLRTVRRIAALARAEYFVGVRVAALAFLAERSEERQTTDGTWLCDADEPSHDLFVVCDGVVEVERHGLVRVLRRGDTANEAALLGASANGERVLSCGSTVLAIPAATLARAIEIFPALGISLYRTKIVPVER